MIRRRLAALALAACALVACSKKDDEPRLEPAPTPPEQPAPLPPGHPSLQDTAPKAGPRVMPAEAMIHTYLKLFGGLSPLDAQRALVGTDKTDVFDSWDAYLDAVGMPDYANDIPRLGRTNTIMIATFERIGAALCDRALEHDATKTPRILFDFDPSEHMSDQVSFGKRFDVLHRAMLGYPAKLAPTDRERRFYELYEKTVREHVATGSRLTANEAGWAVVCQGLIRHPEFHLY